MTRKHSGINQKTGKLKPGYKYSGKKLKSGLPQIIKIKKIQKGGSLVDFSKYPDFSIEQKSQKHIDFFVKKEYANDFCSMSDVLPGRPKEIFTEQGQNGIIARVGDNYVGFLFFSVKRRSKIRGGDYFYLELICTTKNKERRKGYPIGKLLLAKFEELAKKFKINKLKGKSVRQASGFYKKMGWTVESNLKMHKKLM